MSRRRFLIAYDIADDKRLRQVMSLMEGVGERLQYSVFLCDLSPRERVEWEREARLIIKMTADSLVVFDLGPVESSVGVTSLGVPRRLPARGPTVI